MTRFLAIPLVLLAGLAAAEDKPKAKALTPKEIADGWVSLFDGETTFGWRSPNDSKWAVVDGQLYPLAGKPGLLVTTTPFQDYELVFEFQKRPGNEVEFRLGCDRDGGCPKDRTVALQAFRGGWFEGRVRFAEGRPQDVQFSQGRGSIRSAVRPFPKGTASSAPGHIAFAGSGVIFRSIKLRPLDTKPLFNGKDLEGWKEFKGKGKRSKFTVTKEGWLNVKDGPGDLQTTGLYDDFVLQLECISNGKHLNSGIFFRARPGEYQQGYEAQIRNQFTEKPTQKYVLEDYDPKTHKLLGKRAVMATAVDYGTGAIYRRAPARRGVAKDGEWFTLTVVAHKRHFATWVNGVQVVDWDDHRPAKDNARAGYREEKGAISIQGHDPTTDLSFRNFRIAELKAREGKEGKAGKAPEKE
jgi:hypothetical protein